MTPESLGPEPLPPLDRLDQKENADQQQLQPTVAAPDKLASSPVEASAAGGTAAAEAAAAASLLQVPDAQAGGDAKEQTVEVSVKVEAASAEAAAAVAVPQHATPARPPAAAPPPPRAAAQAVEPSSSIVDLCGSSEEEGDGVTDGSSSSSSEEETEEDEEEEQEEEEEEEAAEGGSMGVRSSSVVDLLSSSEEEDEVQGTDAAAGVDAEPAGQPPPPPLPQQPQQQQQPAGPLQQQPAGPSQRQQRVPSRGAGAVRHVRPAPAAAAKAAAVVKREPGGPASLAAAAAARALAPAAADWERGVADGVQAAHAREAQAAPVPTPPESSTAATSSSSSDGSSGSDGATATSGGSGGSGSEEGSSGSSGLSTGVGQERGTGAAAAEQPAAEAVVQQGKQGCPALAQPYHLQQQEQQQQQQQAAGTAAGLAAVAALPAGGEGLCAEGEAAAAATGAAASSSRRAMDWEEAAAAVEQPPAEVAAEVAAAAVNAALAAESMPEDMQVDDCCGGCSGSGASGAAAGSLLPGSAEAGKEEDQVQQLAQVQLQQPEPESSLPPRLQDPAEPPMAAAGPEDADPKSKLAALEAVQAAAEALVAGCEAQAAAAAAAGDSQGKGSGREQQQQQQQHTPPSSPIRPRPDLSPGQNRLMQSVLRVKQMHSSSTTAVSGATAAAAAVAAAGEVATPATTMAASAVASGAYQPGSAAAVAAEGAAGGEPSAAAAAAAGPAAAGEEEDDGMPDPTDAAAMLHWLRRRIPRSLLDAYKEPHTISEEDKQVTQQRLAEYEAEVALAEKTRRVRNKFDLNAASLMPKLHPDWELWYPTYGHKPGVFPGQRFKGRGQLQALGVHTNYYQGIQSTGEKPAFAICLSGGYQDDADYGDWLWYTGKGGRSADGIQAKSQQWESSNAAIRACMEQGKPLRVCRQLLVNHTVVDQRTGREKTVVKKEYTYDGLYAVVKAEMADSQSGKAQVCRFLLVGIPGHYKANRSISFVELRGFRNVRLAGDRDSGDDDEDEESGEEEEYAGDVRYPKRRRITNAELKQRAAEEARQAAGAAAPRCKKQQQQQQRGPKAAKRPAAPALPPVVVQDAAWLAAQQRRRGFLTEDISAGAERRKIPAFNEVDDAPLDPLVYVRSSVAGSSAARELAEAAQRTMPSHWCGRHHGDREWTYTREGLMRFTTSVGHWECCGTCEEHPRCKRNRVISERGIVQPLEVFRTQWKGWGVRCAVDLLPGTFICTYEGELITTHEAEERREGDAYLFDLDHFLMMYRDPSIKRATKEKLPPLPFDATEDCDHLVVDALHTGNVARFINHSCEPNLTKQPVLRPGDSGLVYGMALMVQKFIKSGEELTYNYGYEVGTVTGKEMPCHCGSKKCKGRLL